MLAALDGVAGLLQQSSGVADASVDRFGPDVEQGGCSEFRGTSVAAR
jgi:hypothetical protein